MHSFGKLLFNTFIPQIGLFGNNTSINQESIKIENKAKKKSNI